MKAGSSSRVVEREHAWIREHYPGARMLRQAVTPYRNGKRFDTIVIQTRDGSQVPLWFDITDSYR